RVRSCTGLLTEGARRLPPWMHVRAFVSNADTFAHLTLLRRLRAGPCMTGRLPWLNRLPDALALAGGDGGALDVRRTSGAPSAWSEQSTDAGAVCRVSTGTFL